ncbi:MAG: NfeD family protein [Hyphococcus sp.]
MIEIAGPQDDPVKFALAWTAFGFGAATAASIAARLLRPGSPHRMGDAMTTCRANVVEWRGQHGTVVADGERWRARARRPLAPGDQVTVGAVNGLMLSVKKKSP